MNNSNTSLKLLAIIMTIVTVLLLIAYLVMYFLNRPIVPTEPISYNMFNAEKTGENIISYYNGNHFLKLDTTTQEVSSLTPNIKFPIPNVSDLIWTSHGVYFRFNYPPTTSNLGEYYSRQTFDTMYDITQQYWYAGYNATNIELSFTVDLSPHISAMGYGDSVVYSQGGSLWQLNKDGAIEELAQNVSGRDRFISPLYITDDRFIVALHGTKESEVITVNRTSKERKTVAKLSTEKTQGVTLFANASTVYAVLTVSDNVQQLFSYSLSDNKPTELLAPFTGFVNRDGNDVYAMYTGQDDVVLYKLNGSDTQRLYQFADKTSLPSSTHCFESKCYFVNNRGIARVVSRDKNIIANARLANSSAIEKVVDIEGVALTRNVLVRFDNSYGMVVGQGDITRPYTQLQDQLRAKNINPYDYTFSISQGRYAQPAN